MKYALVPNATQQHDYVTFGRGRVEGNLTMRCITQRIFCWLVVSPLQMCSRCKLNDMRLSRWLLIPPFTSGPVISWSSNSNQSNNRGKQPLSAHGASPQCKLSSLRAVSSLWSPSSTGVRQMADWKCKMSDIISKKVNQRFIYWICGLPLWDHTCRSLILIKLQRHAAPPPPSSCASSGLWQ